MYIDYERLEKIDDLRENEKLVEIAKIRNITTQKDILFVLVGRIKSFINKHIGL